MGSDELTKNTDLRKVLVSYGLHGRPLSDVPSKVLEEMRKTGLGEVVPIEEAKEPFLWENPTLRKNYINDKAALANRTGYCARMSNLQYKYAVSGDVDARTALF
ncbi:hypothetical protein ENBRE01_3480, partial [Enteropsectra breve]